MKTLPSHIELLDRDIGARVPTHRKGRLTCSVVIATKGRPNDLKQCISSLIGQDSLPDEVLIVDSSEDKRTETLVTEISSAANFALRYFHAAVPSAASQRNQGAANASGDILVFLDDDVILEVSFIGEIMRVLEEDPLEQVGGVSGKVVNWIYERPSWTKRQLLWLCVGPMGKTYAGRVVGPGVNFIPGESEEVQEVEWLPSGCCAYRRSVFLAHRFPESFRGYSYAEDVHLSLRVRRKSLLLNTSRARLYHKALGVRTHQDYVELGRATILNRHAIMAYILGRRSMGDYMRLFAYELGYCTAAQIASHGLAVRQVVKVLVGKLHGALIILSGRSPHRPEVTGWVK